MGTRTGQIDPGVLLYLLQDKDMLPDELSQMLYYQSGLKGLSGGVIGCSPSATSSSFCVLQTEFRGG
ncbi:MAG: hypothetical protein ACREYE_04580 [Gammaproteobacteria bacterium]